MLDPTFGTGGRVSKNLRHSEQDYWDGLVIQADGKLVTGGPLALARFNANGGRDRTFGRGGLVKIGPTMDSHMFTLVAQPDGGLLASGASGVGYDDMVVLRFVRRSAQTWVCASSCGTSSSSPSPPPSSHSLVDA